MIKYLKVKNIVHARFKTNNNQIQSPRYLPLFLILYSKESSVLDKNNITKYSNIVRYSMK